MQTMQWTQIPNTGFGKGICEHSLTKVSSKEILLVGGAQADGVSNKVKLFDAEKGEWRSEADLPTEVTGPDGGLRLHRSISVPKGNGVFVFCVGGFVDRRQEKHPDHIAVLDINCG